MRRILNTAGTRLIRGCCSEVVRRTKHRYYQQKKGQYFDQVYVFPCGKSAAATVRLTSGPNMLRSTIHQKIVCCIPVEWFGLRTSLSAWINGREVSSVRCSVHLL